MSIQICRWRKDVSIRAPREGGDAQVPMAELPNVVSIRAPREGGDRRLMHLQRLMESFNPRPPRRGR